MVRRVIMIELVEPKDPSLNPLCPHCEREVNKMYIREIQAHLGRRYIYYCAECLKVLSVSHRKGIFSG